MLARTEVENHIVLPCWILNPSPSSSARCNPRRRRRAELFCAVGPVRCPPNSGSTCTSPPCPAPSRLDFLSRLTLAALFTCSHFHLPPLLDACSLHSSVPVCPYSQVSLAWHLPYLPNTVLILTNIPPSSPSPPLPTSTSCDQGTK
jgi:hypothetical protein